MILIIKVITKIISTPQDIQSSQKNLCLSIQKKTLEEFYNINLRLAKKVLEIGSGDGQQLSQYKPFGIKN